MKDKIEVGEYIRTRNGQIFKVDKQFKNIQINEFQNLAGERGILKHSKNIIDLIEVGDYVNGELIEESDYDLFINSDIKEQYVKTIETIVTKEQFKEMEYKV